MNGDILYLTTADGKSLYVPDDEVNFLVSGNFGAPPTRFLTRKGYKQHGVTEIDYLLDPRTITLQLWHSAACSRQQYWDNRLALHEFLRPNRNGPLRFVIRQPNGQERALTVRADPGLKFPMPSPDVNNWDVNEAIDLTAFDPIWFDPEPATTHYAAGDYGHLVFPAMFPILFGVPTSAEVIATVTYTGTWVSYPTLTVYGPYTTCRIENETTGVQIILNVAVAAGSYRIIDLTPGAQRLVDETGTNHFGDLDAGSDLVDFNLRPDPEVPSGVQVIHAWFTGGAVGQSALQIQYNRRYFAL